MQQFQLAALWGLIFLSGTFWLLLTFAAIR
jgi:hypothetical protein